MRRELPLEHLWGVDDMQAELPQTARALRQWSPEWFEALATSKYIVSSGHLPDFFTRRAYQVILQTWTGTPLKQIGHDFEKIWFTDSNYLQQLDREVAQWSLLVSGNRFSTPVLRRALAFEGEILETGAPRNDILHAPDREKNADRVREQLGLPQGKKVVLYAPTFREDRKRPNGGYQLDLRLDLEAAKAALGEDQVLLVRGHHLMCGQIPGAGNGYIWDVGSYPDMADLLLIADVLVTDYSSTLFDFAGTGLADPVLRARPGALPRQSARFQPRPGGGGARPAAGHLGGAGHGPGPGGRDRRRARGPLRGVPRGVLRAGRRPGRGAGRGRPARPVGPVRAPQQHPAASGAIPAPGAAFVLPAAAWLHFRSVELMFRRRISQQGHSLQQLTRDAFPGCDVGSAHPLSRSVRLGPAPPARWARRPPSWPVHRHEGPSYAAHRPTPRPPSPQRRAGGGARVRPAEGPLDVARPGADRLRPAWPTWPPPAGAAR